MILVKLAMNVIRVSVLGGCFRDTAGRLDPGLSQILGAWLINRYYSLAELYLKTNLLNTVTREKLCDIMKFDQN